MLSRVISTLSGNISGNIMGGGGGGGGGSGGGSGLNGNSGGSKRNSVGSMKPVEPSSRSQKKTSISPSSSPASSPQLSKAFNHVPFRDSVLTWVLKDSLGGNSKTFMLATIASSSKYYPTTHNTLIYASHAKKIVNTVHVNQEKEMITSLKQEIEVLRKQLSLGGGDPGKLKEEIAQREAIIQELTKTLEERALESKEIIEKIEEKHRKELIEKEKEFNNRMQTVIGSIMKEREELAGEMSEYRDMIVLSKGLEEQKNQIDKVHAEMRNFSAIITRIEATMKGMDEHEKTRVDNEKMKSDMEKLQAEVSEKSRELSRLNAELKVEKDKFTDLEKKFIAITSERDHLTKSLAVVEARLGELISHQTTITNDAIEKRIIEIEERYKREIEEMIEQFTLEKEKYVRQIQSQQMVIVGLESELKKIKD
jgi:DNA repair exonuclease SbcCD ATPase subunit